jgi:hypothetical protein
MDERLGKLIPLSQYSDLGLAYLAITLVVAGIVIGQTYEAQRTKVHRTPVLLLPLMALHTAPAWPIMLVYLGWRWCYPRRPPRDVSFGLDVFDKKSTKQPLQNQPIMEITKKRWVGTPQNRGADSNPGASLLAVIR